MTICIAIKATGEGKLPIVLFGSDTQESSSIIKTSVTKLHLISGKVPEKGKSWAIAVASAGNAAVVDEAIDEIGKYLYEKCDPSEVNPSVQITALRKEIGDIAYNTWKRHNERFPAFSNEFELLLGAADEYTAILYVASDGKTMKLDNVGIIGTGRVTGGELIIREFRSAEELTEFEAMNLLALTISTVGRVDMYVGGEPEMLVCQHREVFSYKKEPYRKALKENEDRWDLIKQVWKKMQIAGFRERLTKFLET